MLGKEILLQCLFWMVQINQFSSELTVDDVKLNTKHSSDFLTSNSVGCDHKQGVYFNLRDVSQLYCRDLWHCKKHLKCQNMFNFNFYLCLTYFSRSLEGEKKVIMLLQCGLVYPMPHKGAWYWSQCTWPWWLCVSVGFPSKAQWYPQWEESIS